MMGQQLSIFDFLPSSESQVDEIPMIKNNLVAFPIKEEKVNPTSESYSELYQEMVKDPGRIAHLKRPQEKLPKCGAKEEVDDYGYIEKYTGKTNWLPLQYPVNDLAERCVTCFPPEAKGYPMLTPVRWSVARGETHLMAPGAKSPICGAPDGREGTYTATGEPYFWQTCVRGLTPMCAACEKLEKQGNVYNIS